MTDIVGGEMSDKAQLSDISAQTVLQSPTMSDRCTCIRPRGNPVRQGGVVDRAPLQVFGMDVVACCRNTQQ